MAAADTTKAPAAPPELEAAPAEPALGSAAESTNPAVHYLIAVRDALSRHGGDTAEVTAQLAELGCK